jgi:hypothetical protein
LEEGKEMLIPWACPAKLATAWMIVVTSTQQREYEFPVKNPDIFWEGRLFIPTTLETEPKNYLAEVKPSASAPDALLWTNGAWGTTISP